MVSVMLYPCILFVTLLMYLFALCFACLTVFGETIRNMFVCGCLLLLNVMEVFSVCGGALLDRPYGLPKNVRVVYVIAVWI